MSRRTPLPLLGLVIHFDYDSGPLCDIYLELGLVATDPTWHHRKLTPFDPMRQT